MRFRLRYENKDFEVTGRFLIGRGNDCQLALNDPLVSRAHAVVSLQGGTVVLEDLDSRNGVRVNGQRIERIRTLAHGDRIGIGGQELILIRDRDQRMDTQVQHPTQRLESLGVLRGLTDKAIALGRFDEAERLISPHLQQVLEGARSGRETGVEAAQSAALYAIKLASTTGKERWLEFVFELFRVVGRPCPADVVDELHVVMRKVRLTSAATFHAYLEQLQQSVGELGPAERFLVRRLEGLGRLTGLK
ncbi:MAG TPA: FHA domain-containing protein [Polyangiaceae bacterium]